MIATEICQNSAFLSEPELERGGIVGLVADHQRANAGSCRFLVRQRGWKWVSYAGVKMDEKIVWACAVADAFSRAQRRVGTIKAKRFDEPKGFSGKNVSFIRFGKAERYPKFLIKESLFV